jgi:membrane protein DedA with SNARE-associated domain
MFDQLFSSFYQYSYLAILMLIFLQEVGFPSPFPNELVLLFSGYLSFTGVFKLPLVILLAVTADLLAGVTLYLLFYFFGKLILERKPKWLALPRTKIERISFRINNSGQSAIFIGRLTPFIRGYVAVLCGLLRISPEKYVLNLTFSSIIWATVYIICGYLIAPYWNLMTQSNSEIHLLMIVIPVSVAIILISIHLTKKYILRINQQKIKQI